MDEEHNGPATNAADQFNNGSNSPVVEPEVTKTSVLPTNPDLVPSIEPKIVPEEVQPLGEKVEETNQNTTDDIVKNEKQVEDESKNDDNHEIHADGDKLTDDPNSIDKDTRPDIKIPVDSQIKENTEDDKLQVDDAPPPLEESSNLEANIDTKPDATAPELSEEPQSPSEDRSAKEVSPEKDGKRTSSRKAALEAKIAARQEPSSNDQPAAKKRRSDSQHDTASKWANVGPPHEKPTVPGSFNWAPLLSKENVEAVPVGAFRHAPMADSWANFHPGMKVELTNRLCDGDNAHWIASVQKLAGYKALMRYEGFGEDNSKDFWVNLCSKDIHPVGWCAANKQPLVPPKMIADKYKDWKEFLVKTLTGSKTLPTDFYAKVKDRVEDCPVKIGQKVEIVNKHCISTMRVATVKEIFGRRLRVEYDNLKSNDADSTFWCHLASPVIHHSGWCQATTHKLVSGPEYKNDIFNRTRNNVSKPELTDETAFTRPPPVGADIITKIQVGMKLEARDPVNLSSICPATVHKILKSGYLMVGMDCLTESDGLDWFCFHVTSPYLLPVGFCSENNINLTPPREFSGVFDWATYLSSKDATAVPRECFSLERKQVSAEGGAPGRAPEFEAGHKLEAVDLMDPGLVCVGTVQRVVGRLVKVHFDGWEDSFDQWQDTESPDFYPVGWCELVSFPLQGPQNIALKEEKPKGSAKKPGTRGRKRKSGRV